MDEVQFYILYKVSDETFFNQNLIAFHVLHYWIKLSSNLQRNGADILREWTTFYTHSLYFYAQYHYSRVLSSSEKLFLQHKHIIKSYFGTFSATFYYYPKQTRTNKKSLEGTLVPSGAGPSCVPLLENTMFAIKSIAKRKKQRIQNNKQKLIK